MSTIDKRVVELELDNNQFNREVKSTQSTLEKLKKSLNFDDVSESVEKFSVKFSAMDVMVITALSNIANRLTNIGVNLVKSLSIDNISSGWAKFEQKTKSVATIMAQTIKIAGNEIADYAAKMAAVDDQLTKLNWFTDQTSYNFTDMVENIGKFTAAGQDLDKSVDAMMGIANWAALSGQNAQTASRAMYQLAQAMSKGSVQLIDYKSIQNANMDTQEFRQTVLDTAVALGKLTKEGEKYVSTTGGKTFTRNSFTESLQDKWFTSEVLTESLKKYSSAVERIYEISIETGLTAAQVMARYGDELDAFGLKAFRAAQEARTFTDTINAIKDAVSTGWLNTAEQVFGSYTESKVLWSDLADSLYDVFAAGGDVRNQILKIWSSLNGRQNLFAHDPDHPENQGAFWNIYDAIVALVDKVKTSFRQIFSLSDFTSINEYVNDTANKFKSLTNRLQESTKRFKEFIETNQLFTNTVKTVFGSFKIAFAFIKSVRYAIDPIISTIINFTRNTLTTLSNRLSNITWIENTLDKISERAIKIRNTIEEMVDDILTSTWLNKLIYGLGALFTALREANILHKASIMFKEFVEAFTSNGGTINNFKKILNGVIYTINSFISTAKNITVFLMRSLGPTLSKILGNVFRVLGAILGKTIEILSIFFDELSKLSSKNEEISLFDNIINFINSIKIDSAATSMAEAFVSVLKSLTNSFRIMLEILQYMLPVVNALLVVVEVIVKEVSSVLTNILTKASENGGIKVLILGFLAMLTIATALLITVARTTKKAVRILDSIRYMFNSLAYSFKASAFLAIANAILLMAGAFYLLSKIDLKSLAIATTAISVVTGVMIGIYMLMYQLSKTDKNNKNNTDFSSIRKSINQLMKISFALIEMSAAVYIIGKVAKTFSSMNKEELTNAIIGLGACLVTLYAVMSIISKANAMKFGEGFKFIAATISIVTSLLLVSTLLSILAQIEWSSILLGTAKMVTVFLIIAGALKIIESKMKVPLKALAKLILLDIVFTELKNIARKFSTTVQYLESFNWASFMSSLGKFTLLMATMIGTINIITKFKPKTFKILRFGISISILAGTLKTLAKDFGYIATISFMDILKSLASISLIIASLYAIGKLKTVNPFKIIILSISISEFSASIMDMSKSLMQVSEISFGLIMKALLNVVAMIGVIALMTKMKAINPFKIILLSVATTLLADALLTYSKGLVTLADVPFSSLFKGLLTLVAGFTLLAVVSKVMDPSVNTILRISFAVLILGGALLITAYAIATLSETFNMNVETMWDTLSDFVSGALNFLTTNGEKVIQLIETLITALLQAIINTMPKIGEAVTSLLKMVFKVIRDCLPDLLDTVAVLIKGVLKMLKENIRQWTSDLTNILILMIEELTNKLPELVDALTEFLVVFIESSLYSLAKRLERILNAAISFVLKLIHDLGVTIKNRSREFAETFIEFGINLIEGLSIGIVSGLAKLLEKIPTIGGAIADGFRNIFGIHSPSTVMEEMGMYLDEGLAKGVKENAGATANSISDSMSKVLDAVDRTLNEEIDDSLVLTPVMDLSQVNSGVRDISSLMSSVSGTSMSVTGKFASSASSEIARNTRTASEIQNGITTNNNNTDNYYVTFNVETNNPEELAQQLDSILQRNRLKATLAKGGY